MCVLGEVGPLRVCISLKPPGNASAAGLRALFSADDVGTKGQERTVLALEWEEGGHSFFWLWPPGSSLDHAAREEVGR